MTNLSSSRSLHAPSLCSALLVLVASACSAPPESPQSTDGGQLDAGGADAAHVDAAIDAAADVAIDAADAADATADASVDASIPPAPERLLYVADQLTDGVLELFIASTNGVTTSSHRVNGPLDTGMRVREFATNDDGTLLVYSAKTNKLFDALELFAVDISAVDLAGTAPGTPERLHSDLPLFEGVPSGGVGQLEWVPGKNQVAFIAALDSFSQRDLYLVKLGPSGWEPPVRLNTSLPPDQRIQDFDIAPDGSGLLYRGAQDTAAVDELYWVDLAGVTPAAPVRVSGTFAVDRDVKELGSSDRGYGFSPDASKLFYVADQLENNVQELFVVMFSGGVPGTPTRVNGDLESGGDVRSVDWAPDSQWLSYRAQQSSQLTEGLHIANTAGQVIGTAQLVSSGLFPSAEAAAGTPVWAPDGSGLAFHATQTETSGQIVELFYVETSGTNPAPAVRLNGVLGGGGAVEPNGIGYQTLQWSPDASHLVYTSSEDIANTIELFLVRFGTSGPVPPVVLSSPLPFPASDVNSSLTPIAPDGSAVLFRANRDSGAHEAFVVDLSTSPAGPVTKVNSPMTLGGEVYFAAADDKAIQWSPEGQLIAYVADQEENEDVEVFVVRANQLGSSVRGSGQLVAGGDVLRFEWIH